MKRFSSFILSLFLIPTVVSYVHAESSDQYRHTRQQGIIFAWNGSWDIGPEKTIGKIGYKYWLSSRAALKGFLTLEKTDKTFPNYADELPANYRLRETEFSILIGLEDHFWRRGRLSFMFGGGVQFMTSTSKKDYIIHEHLPQGIKWLKSSKNAIGIQEMLGVEYYLAKKLSLSGQYQIDFTYEKKTDKFIYWIMPKNSQPQNQKTTTWSLEMSTSFLMLTIYL